MKTTLPFVHFCDHASMSTDGKLNLSGIFESLFAMEMPTRHPQMHILTRFHFGKGIHQIQLVLMQQKKVLAQNAFTLDVAAKTQEQNHLWGVYDLTLESYDPIELKVYEDGNEIGGGTLPLYRLPKPFKTPNK